MKIRKYLASECGAALNSDVYVGGGTDDTDALQAILDAAKDGGEGVWLVMDGAALVRGLRVYSNTTIECMSRDCGFFLADHSDGPVLQNGTPVRSGGIVDRNITLLGGTYNQNCPNQIHSFAFEDESGLALGWGVPGYAVSSTPVVDLLFVGVDTLVLRDLVIRDQRTYAALFRNWQNVTIENVAIELPNRVHGQNQDGFHFFGPGRFLSMKNVRGCTSDDFIALAPDEADGESSITDVLIDGVTLDDADQAIRMLCHRRGCLDRVTVRNVTGTYRSYGFFMNPFYNTGVQEGCGYGSITIENVDLRSTAIDYDYTAPFLFRVGGHHRSLTLRNIRHVHPVDSRYLLDIGPQYYVDNAQKRSDTVVESLVLEGLHACETSPLSRDTSYVRVKDACVKHLTIRDVEIERTAEVGVGGRLVAVTGGAHIGNLTVQSVTANGVEDLICREDGTIDWLTVRDVVMSK